LDTSALKTALKVKEAKKKSPGKNRVGGFMGGWGGTADVTLGNLGAEKK